MSTAAIGLARIHCTRRRKYFSMISQTDCSYSISSGQRRSLTEINNLRQEYNDNLHLEKVNFELKLKLLCLENSDRQDSSGVAMIEDLIYSFPNTSSAQPTGFFNELRQKSLELEQRNQLLVRAKLAIEALKQELEMLRGDSRKHSYDLEEQLRHSRLENDDIIYKHHESALAFESQICKANESVTKLEYLKANADEKLVSHSLLKRNVMICNHHKYQEAIIFILSSRIFSLTDFINFEFKMICHQVYDG